MDGMLTDKGYFIVLKEKFLQWHSKEEVSNKLFNIDAINIHYYFCWPQNNIFTGSTYMGYFYDTLRAKIRQQIR